jgi:hypothetical protein
MSQTRDLRQAQDRQGTRFRRERSWKIGELGDVQESEEDLGAGAGEDGAEVVVEALEAGSLDFAVGLVPAGFESLEDSDEESELLEA